MNFTIDDIMKYSWCLSINKEKYERLCKVFKYHNLACPQPYYGTTLRNISSVQNIKIPSNLIRGINITFSHIIILEICKAKNYPYACIFEDDAYPRKDILSKMDYYLKDIPHDCKLLKLGNLRSLKSTDSLKFNRIEQYDEYGSHAYIVFDIQHMLDKLNCISNSMIDWVYKYMEYSYKTNINLFIQYNYDSVNHTTRYQSGNYGRFQGDLNDYVDYRKIQLNC